MKRLLAIAIALTTLANPALAQDSAPVEAAPPLSGLKAEAAALVDGKAKLTQEIVDSLFSFSELGFQEFETQRYLTELLEANGFTVEQGVSGIPSAWWATWGSGEPVIALGSDVDGIPKSSQYPGVLARKPMVDGAPGHGEGHNSGQAVNITAALAVKELMERENLPGTLVIWPGIAEELVATKAWFARDGRYEASMRCCLPTSATACP
jgi:aminobenzoyl-glutamate utilization protein B